MGRGNWFPGNQLEDCRVVYIDNSDDELEPDDYDEYQWKWIFLRDEIQRCLPDSFISVNDHRELPRHLWINDRDSSPLAYNGLFTLWIDEQGDDFHLGIGFTVNEEAPSFAASCLDAMADKFFDKLADSYDLSVRISAWTSAPRKSPTPTTEKAK